MTNYFDIKIYTGIILNNMIPPTSTQFQLKPTTPDCHV